VHLAIIKDFIYFHQRMHYILAGPNGRVV